MAVAASFSATPFESYMLADDTAGHPMTFLVRYGFQGEMDRVALREALDRTTPSHPLLTARPYYSRGQWHWKLADRNLDLDCGTLGDPLLCVPTRGIDLSQQAGMRLWCRTGGGRTELTVQGHHACTDGLGALQFVFDVLASYHQIVHADIPGGGRSGRRDSVRNLDPALLAARGIVDTTPPEPVSLPTQVRGIATEAFKLVARQPKPVRGGSSAVAKAGDTTLELPALHALHLSSEASDAYRHAAKTLGVMANDLFLRDMFLALVRWGEVCGKPLQPRSWLRLTMPMNLRTREQTKMSAANVISYAFITRKVESTNDPAALLASIHAETEAIKYWRLGGMFLAGVAAIQKVRLLRPLLRLPTCFSSIVLSNLGDVRHTAGSRFPLLDGCIVAGNLVLDTFAAAPPPRPKTHAAMVVSRYRGKFSLGLQTDETFDASTAQQFLQLYAAQLEETVEKAGVNSRPMSESVPASS